MNIKEKIDLFNKHMNEWNPIKEAMPENLVYSDGVYRSFPGICNDGVYRVFKSADLWNAV